jgi:hypothetical protein
MKTRLVLLALMITLALASAVAQRRGEAPRSNPPRSNQGRIPAPPVRREPRAMPETEHSTTGHVNSMPHVRDDHWYGHDAPNDARYHLGRSFEHGRFANVGPAYRYNILRIDTGLHRFWLAGGFYFDIAAWDWPLCADWCWMCGDDFIVYDDPDHPGWYLVYNIHTGLYVHALYMGI